MSTNEINHLFFVRHGESEHQVTGLTSGWTDTPLTGLGTDQVSATAVYLRARGLLSIGLYCSDLQRTMESADIIGSILGCTPVPLAELRELNNSDAAQLTQLEATRIQNPEPKSELLDWRSNANAEIWREMTQRTSSTHTKILSCDAKTTVVVGHGNSGQALIQAWLELTLELEVSFHVDVASVTELCVNQRSEREIVRLNSIYDA